MAASDYTHYEWLGVQSNASLTEIREAFARRAKQCHPSKHGQDDADQLKTHQTLTKAFSTLMNVNNRHVYDLDIGLANQQEHQADPWDRCLNPLVDIQQNTYCCTINIESQLYKHLKQTCLYV